MTSKYSGKVIEDEFGTVPVEQDMPFDPERDIINGSEAAQNRREFAGEVRAQQKAKIARLLITDFDKKERLEDLIAHQMKFFDVSGEGFHDVSNFETTNDGLVFSYDFIEAGGESYPVTIKLIGPGKYDINGRTLTLDKIFELSGLQDKSDEDIDYKRDELLTFIVESILF